MGTGLGRKSKDIKNEEDYVHGLTQAVLEGSKTQTRRVLNPTMLFKRMKTYEGWSNEDISAWKKSCNRRICEAQGAELQQMLDYALLSSRYKVGEVVAVAQRYKDIALDMPLELAAGLIKQPGWTNKMFTKADVLTHHIRITKIRIERLQDISPMDCLAEGICPSDQRATLWCVAPINDNKCSGIEYNNSIFGDGPWHLHPDAKAAYADLIDHISGKGTWASNPYVFVYEFELVK